MTKRSRSVDPIDLAVIAAGGIALGFSFGDYYTVTVLSDTDSTSAWHGFYGWFGAVLAAAGSAVVLVALISRRLRFPVPPQFVALVLFVLGAASTFVALFTTGYEPGRQPLGAPPIDSGHGYGYWVSLAVIVTGAVLAAVRTTRIGWSEVLLRRPSGTLGFEPEAAGRPGDGDTT